MKFRSGFRPAVQSRKKRYMAILSRDHRNICSLKSTCEGGKISRRQFIRLAAVLGLGGAATGPLVRLLEPSRAAASPRAARRSGLPTDPALETPRCLDAHVHIGIRSQTSLWTFKSYLRRIRGSPIKGAAMFPFVSQIYDRWEPYFVDTDRWQERRKRANAYLLPLGSKDFEVFPFFFIWNDFAVEGLDDKYRGIKWHRHANEPEYNYDDPSCARAIEIIHKRNLPVILEEELHHTANFILKLAEGVSVIIPHMGFLNGGYRALVKTGLFALPNVYTDTSLASSAEIIDYLQRYGHERILFGSDFPFGDPVAQLRKVMRLPISPEKRAAIAGLNLQRLMSRVDVQTS